MTRTSRITAPPKTPRDGGGLSRRSLLTGAAAAGGAVALSGVVGRSPAAATPPPARLRALTPAEAAIVGAMADRIFPPGPKDPGAVDLGVVTFLDGQLAGGWGSGAGMYRGGPFHEAQTSGHGYQLALTPRELYAHVLKEIDDYCRQTQKGKGMAELTEAQQDAVMTALDAGKVPIGLGTATNGYSSASFFADFQKVVNEGLFSDPIYGGNRGTGGWRWLGYPGDPMAYGDAYWTVFDHHDDPYVVRPQGMKANA